MARGHHDSTAVISNGGTQSTAVNTVGRAFGTVQFPSAFTGTTVTLEGQVGDSGSWDAIRDDGGTQLSITVTASSIFRIPDGAFGCEKIRFVSGSAEGAERTLYVHLVS